MYLQEQAEQFLNAYEVLRESNQAFISRLSDMAVIPRDERMYGTRPAMGVDIVCLAFSVELYVKDLHHAITGKLPRGHKILELFKKLPPHVQREIFAHRSVAKYGWHFGEFEREILAISDGYEKWRYSHESAAVRYNTYFALVLIEALRSSAASARSTAK